MQLQTLRHIDSSWKRKHWAFFFFSPWVTRPNLKACLLDTLISVEMSSPFLKSWLAFPWKPKHIICAEEESTTLQKNSHEATSRSSLSRTIMSRDIGQKQNGRLSLFDPTREFVKFVAVKFETHHLQSNLALNQGNRDLSDEKQGHHTESPLKLGESPVIWLTKDFDLVIHIPNG